MGYKEDIRIIIDELDKEWVKQASLFQNYARQEAMALYARDQLGDALALTQAQLDGDIRLNPKKHGFESKPTEAAILNSIKQNPFYIKANNLLMKASCKAKIIGGAVRSFDHKKKALEKLTDLYLSGYWAAPKIKSEAQEVYGKQTRKELEAALKKEDRLIASTLKKGGAAEEDLAEVKAASKAQGEEKDLKKPKPKAATKSKPKADAKTGTKLKPVTRTKALRTKANPKRGRPLPSLGSSKTRKK